MAIHRCRVRAGLLGLTAAAAALLVPATGHT
jgi:hypothetical protein